VGAAETQGLVLSSAEGGGDLRWNSALGMLLLLELPGLGRAAGTAGCGASRSIFPFCFEILK